MLHAHFRPAPCPYSGPHRRRLQSRPRALAHLPRRNLDAVTRYFGVAIAPESRHRAAGDADATAAVLQRLIGRALDRGILTWEELEALGR